MIFVGCDCDETSANPDELCPADQKCKQCKCIPEGKFEILLSDVGWGGLKCFMTNCVVRLWLRWKFCWSRQFVSSKPEM